MESKIYNTVVLAGLLHDIGKFLGRGSGSMEVKGKHPAISHNFVKDFSPLFEKIADSDGLAVLVEKHHTHPDVAPHLVSEAPKKWRSFAYLIHKADTYSSMERGEPSEERPAYKQVPLASVFARLQIDDNKQFPVLRRYRLKAFSPTVAFPEDFQVLDDPEYNLQLEAFGNEINVFQGKAPQNSFECIFLHLLALLEKYTWCIPSNTQEAVPDVSLFHHLRNTAAIAACLFQFHGEQVTEQDLKDDYQEKFLLLAGDLSGIQDYIFDISHTGAGGIARRLRARSFYLSIIAQIAAHKILHQFNLPMSNLIMASGGNFYLLLPNTEGVAQKIASFQQECDQWAESMINLQMSINLAFVSFSGEDFGDFNKVLNKVRLNLHQAKHRAFSPLLTSEETWNEEAFVLEKARFESEEALCQGCRKLPGRPRGKDKDILCDLCQQDIQIGKKLPQAKYLTLFGDKNGGEFEALGYSFTLTGDVKDIAGSPYIVYPLSDLDFLNLYQFPVGISFLARHIPTTPQGEVVTFGKIAAESRGREILGYLKADVDHLGTLFAFGLKGRPEEPKSGEKEDEKQPLNTISRLSTMARMLDLFFSGWVESTFDSKDSKYRDLYTVFSGGDDLFIIGPWDKAMDFAQELQKEFSRFTCRNPSVTLSAGAALVRPHVPIFLGERVVREALENSKEEIAQGYEEGRNQFTSFDHTLKWEELSEAFSDAQRLLRWLAEGRTSMAFLYGLLTYGNMYENWLKTRRTIYLRFLPLLTYNIARNLPKADDPDEENRKLRLWAEGLKDLTATNLKHLVFIANYALTAARGRAFEGSDSLSQENET